MLLFMDFGDKKVDFMCLDTPDSQGHSRDILIGKTYPIVPYAKDVKVVVDIGANLGAATVLFSLHYPEARVYSLEPQRFPFEILTRNASFYPNTSIVNVGLFDSNRECPLHLSWVDSGTASIGSSWLNTEKTEVIKLRDAAEWTQEQGITSIDILKIDTEGCELPILSRLAPYITRTQVIYFEYHSDADRRAIDGLIGESHVLFSAKAERAHVGELVYVRADLGGSDSDLHKHRIRLPQF
jgi:FkbM family methyltransferase